MTIEMPEEKILETQKEIRKLSGNDTISKKKLQSVIGRVQHLGKCIPPARLFISRLLLALRGIGSEDIPITVDIQRDFEWLLSFLKTWNGRAMIKGHDTHTVIRVHTRDDIWAAC